MENPHMQDPRLDAVFLAYEKLVAQTDTLFGRVRDQFPAEVGCKAGCSDCCHAMFDLSLVEAMYINRKFNECFDFGAQRSAILEAAGEADAGPPASSGIITSAPGRARATRRSCGKPEGIASAVLCSAGTTPA